MIKVSIEPPKERLVTIVMREEEANMLHQLYSGVAYAALELSARETDYDYFDLKKLHDDLCESLANTL